MQYEELSGLYEDKPTREQWFAIEKLSAQASRKKTAADMIMGDVQRYYK